MFKAVAALTPLALGALPTCAHGKAAARATLFGGATLQQGNAIWLQGGGGFDIRDVLTWQVGYAHAFLRNFDLAFALQGNVGVGTVFGGSLRARWGLVRREKLALALDLPLSFGSYTDGEPPHLQIYGTEPGVLMSTFLGSHIELIYGATARIFYAESTYYVGPQARLGMATFWDRFIVSLVASTSRLFVTDTPSMSLFNVELGFGFRFGGDVEP